MSGGNLKLKFGKINYKTNLEAFNNNQKPKDFFHQQLINFLTNNFENEEKFLMGDKYYQICALDINEDYIFGKLWRLRDKTTKGYMWTGTDYEPTPEKNQDYVFNYFLITLDTHHIIIQERRRYKARKVIWVLQHWFDEYYNISKGIEIQFLKQKRDILEILKRSKKITYAKFVLYPSNIDFDFISEPLDKELKKRKIKKYTEEMESDEGIQLDMNEPNIFSSALVQSLRGNGKPPKIRIEDKSGKKQEVSTTSYEIVKIIKEIEEIELKKEMIKLLRTLLEELDD